MGALGAGRRRAAAGGSPCRAAPAREASRRQRVDVRERAAAQSQAAREVVPAAEQPTQLTLDLGDRPRLVAGAGLPEMTGPERVRAELDVLGLDVSAHVVEFYAPLLRALGVTRSRDLLGARSRSEVWVAGVKVATQTPPVRSGRRVVFLTLDDSTGPADCTFFEDVQGPYADVVFHSWLLLVRGVLRRTGDRGVSIRATGAWELAALWDAWQLGGLRRASAPRSPPARPTRGPGPRRREAAAREQDARTGRRVLVHASGFRQSPYADTRPPGVDPRSGRGAPGQAAPVVPDGSRPPRCPRASCGTRAPAAPDTRVGAPHAAATARPTTATPTDEGGPTWPTSVRRARRGGAQPGLRTAAVQAVVDALAERRSAELGRPLRVLDLGGGTGGTAVPLAAAGHDVTVVDPSPDALASLRRRAAETGTAERVHPVQGDTDTVGELAADGEQPGYDLVCLPRHPRGRRRPGHRPAPTSPAVLAPGGTLSLVVAQRLARRARPGPRRPVRPGPARILERPDGRWGDDDPAAAPVRRGRRARPARRATASPCVDSHGVRIFSDLVPSALVDSEADRTALARARGGREPPPRPPAARGPRQRPPRPRDGRDLDAAGGPPMSRRQFALPQRASAEPPDDTGCTVLHVDMDAFYASATLLSPPRPRRHARHHRRRQPRGRALGHLRGPALRGHLGDADDPRPPAVPAGHRPAARTTRCYCRDLRRGHGDLPRR